MKRIVQLIAITWLVLFSGFSTIKHWLWTEAFTISSQEETLDGISVWEQRLSRLKDNLPPDGIIGYVSDWDIPGEESSSDLETEYRLTQYTLAPLVLTRGTGYNLVVGNIASTPLDDNLQKILKVKIIEDYGFGIYLLEGNVR